MFGVTDLLGHIVLIGLSALIKGLNLVLWDLDVEKLELLVNGQILNHIVLSQNLERHS